MSWPVLAPKVKQTRIAISATHVNLDGAKATMAGAMKQMLASMPTYQFKRE